jgi:hypothetical protein
VIEQLPVAGDYSFQNLLGVIEFGVHYLLRARRLCRRRWACGDGDKQNGQTEPDREVHGALLSITVVDDARQNLAS